MYNLIYCSRQYHDFYRTKEWNVSSCLLIHGGLNKCLTNHELRCQIENRYDNFHSRCDPSSSDVDIFGSFTDSVL